MTQSSKMIQSSGYHGRRLRPSNEILSAIDENYTDSVGKDCVAAIRINSSSLSSRCRSS